MSSSFPPSGNQDPFSYNPQSGNGGFGGEQLSGQPYGSSPYGFPPRQPASMALAALFSLILSIVSPFFICVCLPYVTAAVSLAGIVLGHIALLKIRKSGGTLSGSGLAIGGLIVGYPVLLLGVLFSSLLFLPSDFGKREPGFDKTPAGRLEAAEKKIGTDNDGIAHGNTPEAQALAQKYAQTMKTLREEFFTKGKKGISLSGGNFVTYCELHEGRCAFITHVPQYRKFTGDAKDSLAEIAWEAAQETVSETLHEGDELGVGLKGVVIYGSVMVGHVTIAGDEKRGLEDESEVDKSLLEPFFETEEAPSVPPIKLDEPEQSAEPKAVSPETKP